MLASSISNTSQRIIVATHQLLCPRYSLQVKEVHVTSTDFKLTDWQFSIIDYSLRGILLDDLKEAISIRWRSPRFYCDPVVKMLYHCSYDGIMLRCLSNSKAREALKEAHDGICSSYQPAPKLQDRLRWLSYYWPTMIADGVQYASKTCQIYADFIHQPPELIHPTSLLGYLKHGE